MHLQKKKSKKDQKNINFENYEEWFPGCKHLIDNTVECRISRRTQSAHREHSEMNIFKISAFEKISWI